MNAVILTESNHNCAQKLYVIIRNSQIKENIFREVASISHIYWHWIILFPLFPMPSSPAYVSPLPLPPSQLFPEPVHTCFQAHLWWEPFILVLFLGNSSSLCTFSPLFHHFANRLQGCSVLAPKSLWGGSSLTTVAGGWCPVAASHIPLHQHPVMEMCCFYFGFNLLIYYNLLKI